MFRKLAVRRNEQTGAKMSTRGRAFSKPSAVRPLCRDRHHDLKSRRNLLVEEEWTFQSEREDRLLPGNHDECTYYFHLLSGFLNPDELPSAKQATCGPPESEPR